MWAAFVTQTKAQDTPQYSLPFCCVWGMLADQDWTSIFPRFWHLDKNSSQQFGRERPSCWSVTKSKSPCCRTILLNKTQNQSCQSINQKKTIGKLNGEGAQAQSESVELWCTHKAKQKHSKIVMCIFRMGPYIGYFSSSLHQKWKYIYKAKLLFKLWQSVTGIKSRLSSLYPWTLLFPRYKG